MSVIVLPNVFLPNNVIDSGVKGKLIRKNTRNTMSGGAEQINIDWVQSLREFEIGFIPMPRAAWQAIEQLHEITFGGAYGFLMDDPKDQEVTTGIMGGLGSNQFQLYKRGILAGTGRGYDRKITRPRANGLQIYVNGVWIDPVFYTLDVTTGIVTIPSNPSPPTTLTWTGHFYVPVHFQSDSIDWTLVVPGAVDARFVAGPSCILEEIRE